MANNNSGNIIGWLLGGAAALLIGRERFKSKKLKVTDGSDCHEVFKAFDKVINVDPEKIQNLKSAHNTLRTKIRDHFIRVGLPKPRFFIQGSYKTRTLIENVNDTCDVDLSVILPDKPNVSIKDIYKEIEKALSSHTTQGFRYNRNCVRLKYKRKFHVDVPLFYESGKRIFFGSRQDGWVESNPIQFYEWFNKETIASKRKVRIIRYLKAWSEHVSGKMPSGVIFTLWVLEFYKRESNRDDVAFVKTCQRILEYLDSRDIDEWEAKMPIAPYDNVLNRLSERQKEIFLKQFTKMVELAEEAVEAETRKEAIQIWKKIFGPKFGTRPRPVGFYH